MGGRTRWGVRFTCVGPLSSVGDRVAAVAPRLAREVVAAHRCVVAASLRERFIMLVAVLVRVDVCRAAALEALVKARLARRATELVSCLRRGVERALGPERVVLPELKPLHIVAILALPRDQPVGAVPVLCLGSLLLHVLRHSLAHLGPRKGSNQLSCTRGRSLPGAAKLIWNWIPPRIVASVSVSDCVLVGS
eukprot:COSAG01_NODE_10279_length_2202_cov_2.184974_1_plen_193_part_00